MTTYVSDDDVLAAMPISVRPDPESEEPDEVAAMARIASLRVSTAEMIDAETSLDFHRYPEADPYAEDVERLFDGRGSSRLHVHHGVVTVSAIAVRYSLNGSWTDIDEDDYELVSMYDSEDHGRPYDHIQFNRRLPLLARGVRVTGVHGWATVPARLAEMNVAWIRNHLAAGDSYSGSAQMPDGAVPYTPRLMLPDDVRIFLTRESQRYAGCYT